MIEQRKERNLVWGLVIVSIMVFAIFCPTLLRLAAIDLDDYVEEGTFWYMLVHDSRWILGALLGLLIAELHLASKGLLKEGIKELKEWWRGST